MGPRRSTSCSSTRARRPSRVRRRRPHAAHAPARARVRATLAAVVAGAFEEAARAEKARREVEGIGDTRENMQPIDIPTVAIGMRLERLCWYDFTDPAARAEAGADGGFMWCACTVLAVENVAKGPRSVYKDGEAAWVAPPLESNVARAAPRAARPTHRLERRPPVVL